MSEWLYPNISAPEDPRFWQKIPKGEKETRKKLLEQFSTKEEKVAFIITVWQDDLARELVQEILAEEN